MDYYKLAKVLKPQGLKGELKLKPYTDDPERFYDLSHIFIKSNNEFIKYNVNAARLYKQFVYLKIDEINTYEEADKHRNSFLYIDKNSAKKPEGSYFIADLIGMKVIDEHNNTYGELSNVFNTGSTDIYCVKNGKKELMFPAAPGVIISVDEEKRLIIINSIRLDEVAVYD